MTFSEAAPLHPAWTRIPLRPFGVELIAHAHDSSAGLHQLPADLVQSLIREHRLIVVRGWCGPATETALEEFARTLGTPQRWGSPPGKTVLDIRMRPNPRKLFDDSGFMPMHWDGIHDPTPALEIFQCLQAPPAHEPGATLFCDTAGVLADTEPATRALWQSLIFRYESRDVREQGEVTHSVEVPLVVAHPHNDFPTLRFREPIPHSEDATRVRSTHLDQVPDGHDLADIMEGIRRALYDTRHLYPHHWQVGDLVIADNHALLHTREPYSPTVSRHLQRITVLADQSR
ncbi:TauD/TfdA family dioxygenase [Streptosporangium sp. NPDC051023]|uniref:TauD/TfdA dioxygenase family protein n=1 Tax=Streptosporangium sp. NPDC051023 TaxID=3155410 RepID=UPI00344F2A33